jgi:hypothetical protein
MVLVGVDSDPRPSGSDLALYRQARPVPKTALPRQLPLPRRNRAPPPNRQAFVVRQRQRDI